MEISKVIRRILDTESLKTPAVYSLSTIKVQATVKEDRETFIVDYSLHFLTDLFAEPRNGHVKTVIAADFGVCPTAPSIECFQ